MSLDYLENLGGLLKGFVEFVEILSRYHWGATEEARDINRMHKNIDML